jgi:hypothetical protein
MWQMYSVVFDPDASPFDRVRVAAPTGKGSQVPNDSSGEDTNPSQTSTTGSDGGPATVNLPEIPSEKPDSKRESR